MGATMRRLLDIEHLDLVFGDIPNTCVHVINMPNPSVSRSVFGGATQPPPRLVLEAFGSTGHLG